MAIVGRPREVQSLGGQRQQRLPGAGEKAESLEDQPDRLLQPLVRIEAETDLTMPDISHRYRDPEFTTTRLRLGGVEHARTKHAELELADAALHTQKQAIVRPARIVDTVEIDHPRLNQTAELEQVMPVTTVARQTRGIEAKHGADLPGTQSCHQTLEARPGHHAARRPAKIVVDDLYTPKPAGPGDLYQLVLPSLALEIDLDLRRRRLPDVDHSLARENGGGKCLNVRHRDLPPRVPRPRSGESRVSSLPFGVPRRLSRAAMSSRTPLSVGVAAQSASISSGRSWSSSLATDTSSEELRLNPRRASRS